jgi:uncharacterized protein
MSWLSSELSNGRDFASQKSTVFCILQVRKTAKGEGVFSDEAIRKGSVIARDGGVVVSSDFDDFPEYDFPKYGYSVLIDEGILLVPRDYECMNPIWYLNHGCDSNVARIGGLIFTAKRDIQAGEELLIDYSALMAGYEDWSLDCACGSPRCRRRITSSDWTNPRLARELWQEWLPFVQKKILERLGGRST